MNRVFIFFAFILLLTTAQILYAQSTVDTKQRYALLGDFTLESGQHIQDCKIGYRIFGKMNTARSNVIVYPTSGGITTHMMELFGVGSEVDTNRFCIIMMDALGNGISSSPSNSTHQPRTLFPRFNMRDMVNTQYKALAEKLSIPHLVAVVGSSMGACQALQWAVSYPDFMDKIVSIEGTPKVSTYDLLWMHTYIEAVKTDTGYHSGNYSTNPPTLLAIHMTQLLLTSPAYMNRTVPTDSFATWLSSFEKPNPFAVDCNNFIWQTHAMMAQDISTKAGGSWENTAKIIKAKMLIIANKQDRTLNQALSIQFAGLTKAQLIVMDDDLGHLIFSQKIPIDATRSFLSQ